MILPIRKAIDIPSLKWPFEKYHSFLFFFLRFSFRTLARGVVGAAPCCDVTTNFSVVAADPSGHNPRRRALRAMADVVIGHSGDAQPYRG